MSELKFLHGKNLKDANLAVEPGRVYLDTATNELWYDIPDSTATSHTRLFNNATELTDGLLSALDKTRIDYTNVAYGTCASTAASITKQIVLPSASDKAWQQRQGAMICVYFSNTNTAKNPKFQVNGSDEVPVYYNGSAIATSNLNKAGYGGRILTFVFDNGKYHFVSWSYDTLNTAGSSNSDKKLFLIGATSQTSSGTTYSHDTAYVGTNGHIYSNSSQVLNQGELMSIEQSTIASNSATSTANRTYPIGYDSNGKLSVNVPWANTWQANALSKDGYVTKTTAAKKNQVWKTDDSGNPAWREDSDTKDTAGTTNLSATQLYLVGSTAQDGTNTTNTNSAVYIDENNILHDGRGVLASEDSIKSLSSAMIFKGTLGTGGTISTLPTANKNAEGDTYKVITAGTYASIAAKVGDVFVCGSPKSGEYTWILIPSGDEPSGTVTSIATSGGLTGGPITTSGTLQANLVNYTKNTSAAGTGTLYAVQLDKNDKLSVNVPWTDKKVYQAYTNTSQYRPLIMGYSNNTTPSELIKSDNSTSYTESVYASTHLYARPDKGMIFTNSDTTDAGFYLMCNNKQTGYLKTCTKGTASEEGKAYLLLGNETPAGQDDNYTGHILLYGPGEIYHRIQPLDAANNRTLFLRDHGANAYIVATTSAAAVGSATTPVYISDKGVPTTISYVSVAKGGTGTTTAPTKGGIIYGASTTGYGCTAAGTAGQILKSTGTGAPAWVDLSSISDSLYVKKTGDTMTGHLIICGNNNTTGWEVRRNSAESESVKLTVNDSEATFYYANDERSNSFKFVLYNADTESPAASGALPNTSIVTFTGSSAGSTVNATAFSGVNGTFTNTYSQKFALRNSNSAEIGSLFAGTLGTTSTIGEACITVGNSTASGNNNNARGRLRLYGSSSGYTDILCGTNNSSNFTLKLPGASGQLVYHTDDTAIGGVGRPVYIAESGAATPITQLSVAYGGTGATSFTGNRMAFSSSGGSSLTAGYHYVDSGTVQVANTTAKDYTFYVGTGTNSSGKAAAGTVGVATSITIADEVTMQYDSSLKAMKFVF